MINKISLRTRITLLSLILLSACCVCLTTASNFSADKMALVIVGTTKITPSSQIVTGDLLPSSLNYPVSMEKQTSFEELPASAVTAAMAKQNFFTESMAYMVLIVLAGGIATYLLVGRALEPLEILNEQMKNKTIHNLSAPTLPVNGNNEVSQLTHSFNQMNEKLNEAFAMQKRFSQSAAHELRTPLAVIKTKIAVFHKKPDRTLQEYKSLVNSIEKQNNRLSALVQEMLELSNLDAIECKQNISLSCLVQTVCQELLPFGEEKQICILQNIPQISIFGNEPLLYRVFYNLIENAIKYNVVGGTIEISAKEQAQTITIAIEDSGIGISDSVKPFVFEPFFRADVSRSRQMGGAGLGLSVVKTIIEKHNGTIQLKDAAKGGCCFICTLPK